MPRVGALSSVLGISLIASACGVAGSSSYQEPDGPEPEAQVAVTETLAAAAVPVGLAVERRLGAGRAIAAASNGRWTVVATTAEVAVREDPGSGFRSIAPLDEAVRDVAISADGGRTITLSESGMVDLRSTADGGSIAALDGATDADFRVDGSLIVVGRDLVRVVDPTDGTSLGEWAAPEGRIIGPHALSADGRIDLVLTGGSTPEVVSWTDPTDPRTTALALDDDPVISRIVAGDERFALEYVDEFDALVRQIAVFDVGVDEPLWSVEAAADAMVESWWMTDDSRVAVADSESITLVDAAGQPLPSIPTSASVARFHERGFVELVDGSVFRLDESDTVLPGLGPLADLHADDRSGVASYVDSSGRVGTIRPGATDAESSEEFVAAAINDVAVSADGRVATASVDGIVEVRTLNDGGDGVVRLVHDEGNVDSVAFSADGAELATGVAQRRAATAFDDTVSLWPASGGTRDFEIGGEAEDVAGCSFFTNRLRFSNDGTFVVSTSHDFTVSVIAIPSGELLHTFPPHGNTVLDVAISPDDATLVTSADDSTLRVWDLTSYELVADHAATMGGYWSLSFVPGRDAVVAGDLSGNVSTIDLATGDTMTIFEGSKARQARTAVSPDGRLVAAGGDGSVLRVWSIATGQLVGEAAAHTAAVSSVDFFDDSTRLVSASRDGTAIVWRLTT